MTESVQAPPVVEVGPPPPFDPEVAAAVHWLASPASEWASGAIVDLNGASYLRT